jgi:hypothetical protein
MNACRQTIRPCHRRARSSARDIRFGRPDADPVCDGSALPTGGADRPSPLTGAARAGVVAAYMMTALALTSSALAQATFPMVKGELAATYFSGFNLPNNPGSGINNSGFSVAVFDVRLPPCCANPVPVLDTNWPAPSFHNEFPITANTWNAANLGQVFGLALDDQTPPNLYVSATTAYGNHPFSASGPGAVFKLNGVSGAITPLIVTGGGLTGTNTLANTGPALGDVCHDPVHNQFFVSNFENGEITRHDASGVILSRLDPFAPDGGGAGFAPLGERVWALQVFGGRLYFSVWLRDEARPGTPWNPSAGPSPPNLNNSIWSIQLDGITGDFVGAPLLEIVLPYLPAPATRSNPVSDIAFSNSGAMIVGERTMSGDVGILGVAHLSRDLHYTGGSGSWAPSGLDFFIGRDITNFGLHINSAGGVDFDCDENVWSSGDALHFSGGDLIYGLQRVPAAGNTNATATSTSYLIDLDGNTTQTAKTYIGDVEVYLADPCGDPLDVCPLPAGNDLCLAKQDSDCQSPLPTTTSCVPQCVIVDSTAPDGFVIEQCDCIEGCGEVAIISGLLRCPGVCPDPPPGEFCQIHFDGVPQGTTDVAASAVPDGTKVTCDCAPEPQVCPLPPNDIWCANLQNTDCVNAAGECLLTAVLVDFNQPGIFQPVECACIEGCGIVDIQGDLINCPNRCPIPGQLCQIHFDGVPQGVGSILNTAVPNGTIVTCDCDDDPPMICGPAPGGQGCNPFVCPDPTEQCIPRCVRDDGTGVLVVEDCACRDQGECHIVFNTGVPPFCEGICPPGETCIQTISFDPLTGEQIICCDCEPVEICGPTTDGTRCKQVTCPDPTEECISKCIRQEIDGTYSVVYCECDDPDECHIELVAGAEPMCVGICPPNETCQQTFTVNADGTVDICCECMPFPPDCQPTMDKTACEPFVCPIAGEECRPRCLREYPASGLVEVIDCECRPVDDCHAVFDPVAGLGCEGNCPPGYTCLENRIVNSDGTVDVCCDCVRRPCKCPGDLNGDGLVNGRDIQGFINCVLGVPRPDDNCTCADMNGDGISDLADLIPFVSRILLCVPCFPPACPPSDLVIDLATGVDNDGNLIPFGTDDDMWVVTCEPPPGGILPRPATVINAHPAWLTIPGTRWIAANANGPNGDYCYDFCFCLDGRFTNPNLTIQLRADDRASVFLNGNLIGATPPIFAFNTPVPTQINVTNPSLFLVGENCIRVVVSNTHGVVTGLNLAGTMTATDGQCCCDENDLDQDMSSGVDDDGNLIAIGADDDTWDVTVDASGGTVPRPATVIAAHPAWLTIPGTRWIAANATGPNGLYVYEACFCLDPRFENAQLLINLRADDRATVCLNGIEIGATPPLYSFNTPQPTQIYVTNQDLFVCGKNCIEFKVTNSHGVVTGVNFSVQVTADKGLCCCAPNPLDDTECCPEQCEDPDEQCVPRCIHVTPSGVVSVTDCECRDQDECRVAPILPMTLPVCINGCPPGEFCDEQFFFYPDGSIDLCCDCKPAEPLGACCLPNGHCVFTNVIVCQDHAGIYLGDGILCEGDEACCLPDGTCIVVDRACCGLVFGGTPQGAGSVCLGDANGNGIDDRCEGPPQELSCCFEDGTCVDLAPGVMNCPVGGTLVIGPCGNLQACCLPDGTCDDLFVACCLQRGGTPQGNGSNCMSTVCPQQCQEDPTGLECTKVQCPNPDDRCVPRCVTLEQATGAVINLDCNCRPFDQCFVEVSPPPSFATCVNVCPPGQVCERTEMDNGDGTVTICCDCVDAPPEGSCCDSAGQCFAAPVGGCPPGTTFHPDPCDPVQGCCLPNDTCVNLEPQCCADLGGVVTANLCAGAVSGCCLPDGSCLDLDPECCLARQGMPQPAPCQPPEACCFEPPFAPLCIDTDPQCCLAAGGTPQGVGTSCMGDLDGDGVDDACQDPPPGICPLPAPPVAPHCANLQTMQCQQGAAGEECLPVVVVTNIQGQVVFIEQCRCFFPDACGPVNVVGSIISCPGICPPGENCQIIRNGVATGMGSIDASMLPSGTTLMCGCDN